jgi:DNA polymerase-3 subunit delta'
MEPGTWNDEDRSHRWPIVGNQRVVAALSAAVASGDYAHAYLFAGPEHVGRAAVARLLAQALNCEAAERPCGECAACRRIAAGIHSDVVTVGVQPSDEGGARTAISVEQLRDVQATVSLNPFEGRLRVVIIDPADEMTAGAQNAFLKTLEEPPPNTVFVLIASREDRLLETVHSRCRRLAFRLVPVAEVEAALRERGVPGERAALLARLARGRPGWAFRAAADDETLAARERALDQARSLPALSVSERMELAERLSEEFKKDREAVLPLLAEWQAWWRDVMLVQSGAGEGVAAMDRLAALAEDAGAYPPQAVTAFVRAIGDARQHLGENVPSRLVLEWLMLEAPRARKRIPSS